MTKPTDDQPAVPRRTDPGTLWPSVWTFMDHLTDYGYTPLTVAECSRPARHFTLWLANLKIAPFEIDGDAVERFLDHRCQCRRQSPDSQWSAPLSARSKRDLYRFLRFLAENGAVPMLVLPELTARSNAIDERVAEFLDWLRRHRGSSEATIAIRRGWLRRILPALGPDPALYDAGLIHRMIIEAAGKYSTVSVQSLAATLRGYLRFLVARGICRPGVDHAVPTVARWRLSSLPRYLSPADVEKLIASCDLTTRAGIRDHAALLLLARLGLRAGDVWMMRIGDIDWERGTLSVCGKGRRETRLPLPQDAGDALLSYLCGSRPRSQSDRIFLRARPPIQPFENSSAISRLVGRALDRAGITGTPSRGAHLLRHSAATTWLRAGATLDTIGTILRHRSTDTTAHYAKVDFSSLGQITQPWPGEQPC